MSATARLTAARQASWWNPLAALGVAALVLGVALLGPRAFSDPYGVDPYSLRLGAAALLLLGAAWAWQRLSPARPVLLAVAAVTVPFVAWSATPRMLYGYVGAATWLGPVGEWARGLNGNQLFFWATVVQMVLTLAFVVLAQRRLPAPPPDTRLARLGRPALLLSIGGSVALLLLALATPATWLGRLGIQPQALARDLPWLGPGDVLQAAAQEVQFRGLLLGVLEGSLPPWAANLAQASLFGLAHIAVNYEGVALTFVPVTIALGFALGWATQRTRSLWPAIVVHAVGELAVTVGVMTGLYGY